MDDHASPGTKLTSTIANVYDREMVLKRNSGELVIRHQSKGITHPPKSLKAQMGRGARSREVGYALRKGDHHAIACRLIWGVSHYLGKRIFSHALTPTTGNYEIL